jgi:hypothetical protein
VARAQPGTDTVTRTWTVTGASEPEEFHVGLVGPPAAGPGSWHPQPQGRRPPAEPGRAVLNRVTVTYWSVWTPTRSQARLVTRMTLQGRLSQVPAAAAAAAAGATAAAASAQSVPPPGRALRASLSRLAGRAADSGQSQPRPTHQRWPLLNCFINLQLPY